MDRNLSKLPLKTLEFAEYVKRILKYSQSRVHPATRVFQALRIEVNQELSDLETLLNTIPQYALPGAKVAFISFHSLEDRLIKQRFRLWQKGFLNSKEEESLNPFSRHQNLSLGREIPKGGLVPSEEEIQRNPRSRSARLRVFHFAASPESV